jgi:hypothetical protein
MAELQQILAGLERRKSAYLAEVANWPTAALKFRPQPQTWCALEILDHLIKTEKNITAMMLTNLKSANPLSLGDRVRGVMMLALFYSPVRVKVPGAAAVVLPQPPGDLSEIIEDWKRTREFMSSVIARLEAAGVATRSVGVFRHPVAGWMSPATTLRFLDSHLAHHQYQWRRLRSRALSGALA